jgi:hypothetical protein
MVNKSSGFILMECGKVLTLMRLAAMQPFNRQLGTTISISTVTWVLKIDGLPDFQ